MDAALRVLTASPWRSRLHAAKVPLLLLYGVAAFAFAIAHFDAALPDDVRLMGSRTKGLSDSIAVLDRGGPPLLGCTGPYVDHAAAIGRRCFATGVGDDQGLYLYLPLVGKLFGETDPALLLKWLFTWLMALVVLVYPLLFATLFRSTAVGLLAPLPVLFGFDFLQNTDIYWIVGWASLLGLPLVLLAAGRDRWDRQATGLLLAAMAVGGFATSIRSHAGLPLLVAAAIVVLLRGRRWRYRALTIGVLAGTYLVFSSLPMLAAREYRDHSTGVDLSSGALTAHPFWHPMYLGLGYLPNRYGIEWNDTVALDAVTRERPGTAYLSREYEHTLRGLYLDILREDPGFVAKTYGFKLRDLLRQLGSEFGLALLLIPAMLLRGPDARRRRLFAALSAPALVITALPPVLTRPEADFGFQVGFLSSAGLLCLLGAAFGVVAAQRSVAALAYSDVQSAPWTAVRPRLQESRARLAGVLERRRLALLAAGAALALVVLALSLTSGNGKPRIDYEALATPLVRDAALQGASLTSWDFGAGAPADWQPQGGVAVTPSAEGTKVITTEGVSEYQLMSDAIVLDAGRYRLDLKGAVRAGGIELGALDATTNSWLSQAHYWSGQSDFESSSMTLPLMLEDSTKVQFVLANWNAGRASEWTIDELRLVRG
jgi:hypothetical protein